MRPITAQPGFTEATTHALLASRQFAYADCYSLISQQGDALRWTTTQKDVNIANPVDGAPGPVVYSSNEVKISGLQMSIGIGVEIDEQTMRMDFDPTLQYRNLSYPAAIRYGRFDGCTVRRDRYFTARLGTPWVGGVPLFVGKVSTADKIGRSFAEIKVKSDLVLLKMPMPRKLFQPQCLHTIFDTGCGLDKADFEFPGTAEDGSTASFIKWAGATDDYVQGTIYVEDAGGVTLVRTVESFGDGGLYLTYPLDFLPPVGTNFKAYPGCSRSYARCARFENQANYQGFPFVPVAETAY